MHAEEEFSWCLVVSTIQTTVSFSLIVFTTLSITATPYCARQIGFPIVLILLMETGIVFNQMEVSCMSVSQSVKSKKDNYYQSRENNGTIRLIRQADARQSMDSSYYCCQLVDATSTMQTLCVTIGKRRLKIYCTIKVIILLVCMTIKINIIVSISAQW